MTNVNAALAGGVGLLTEALVAGAVIGAVKEIVPKKKKEEEKKEEPKKDDGMFHLLSG